MMKLAHLTMSFEASNQHQADTPAPPAVGAADDENVLSRSLQKANTLRVRDSLPEVLPDMEISLREGLHPRQRRKHESIRGAASRTIRGRGRDIYTSDIPLSRLGNLMASGEGMLESDAWLVIDFAFDDLTGFVAQPFPIFIDIFGQRHKWTPDALLYRSEQPIFVEVKPLEVVHPDPQKYPEKAAEAKARFAAMRLAATDYDAGFLLLTEVEVRVEPRFYNAQMMFRAINAHIPDSLVLKAADALASLPLDTTVSALSPALGEHSASTVLVACLLDRRNLVRLDRSAPFSTSSRLVNALGGMS